MLVEDIVYVLCKVFEVIWVGRCLCRVKVEVCLSRTIVERRGKDDSFVQKNVVQ